MLLLMLFIPFASVRAEDETEAVWKKAEEAYANDNPDKGRELLEQLIQDNPGDVSLAARVLHRLCCDRIIARLDKRYLVLKTNKNFLRKHISGSYRGRMQDGCSRVVSSLHDAMFYFPLSMEELQLPISVSKGWSTREMGPVDAHTAESAARAVAHFKRRHNIYRVDSYDPEFDRAAKRLRALRDGGFLPRNHPLLSDLYIMELFMYMCQGRLYDAAKSFDDVVSDSNNDPGWLFARARFYDWLGSERAGDMFLKLFVLLEKGKANSRFQELSKLAEQYQHYLAGGGPREPRVNLLAGMVPEDKTDLWRAVLNGRISGVEQDIDGLIGISLANDSTMPGKNGKKIADCCAILDWQLRQLPAASLKGLRELQERACSTSIAQNDLEIMSSSQLLAMYRRYPWSATAHRALLLVGRRELMAGRGQSPRRSFRDILDHSLDTRLCAQAQAGLWMAIARSGDKHALVAAFKNIKDSDRFPWMGEEVAAGKIEERLLEGIENSNDQRPTPNTQHRSRNTVVTRPLTLSSLRPQVVGLPAARFWPASNKRCDAGIGLMSMQFADKKLLVTSQNAMLCYDIGDVSRPAWIAPCGEITQEHKSDPVTCRPTINDGTIYRRWGYKDTPSQVAAFDLQSGRAIWGSNRGQAAVTDTEIPLIDSTLCEGLLYNISWDSARGRNRVTGRSAMSMSCIDSATGSTVWQSRMSRLPERYDFKPSNNISVISSLASPPVVHDGAVYLSSGMGYVARHDIRDGRMEWCRKYEPENRRNTVPVLSNSPLIINGNTVICRPRDCSQVMCLDIHTGGLIWENSMLSPIRLLAMFGDKVIVQGEFNMAALDVETGAVIWLIPLKDIIVGQPQLIGTDVVMGTTDGLRRIDVSTGNELEFISWPKCSDSVRNFAVNDGKLYVVTGEPRDDVPSTLNKPFNSKLSATSKAFRLPLKTAWSIDRPGVKLYVPPDDSLNRDKAILHSREVLECIDVTPRGGTIWRKLIGPEPAYVFLHDDRVVLFMKRGSDHREGSLVMIYDIKTGNHVRNYSMPVNAHWRHVDSKGPLLFIRRHSGVGVFDMIAGKLLWDRDGKEYSSAYMGVKDNTVHVIRQYYWTPEVLWQIHDLRTGARREDSPERVTIVDGDKEVPLIGTVGIGMLREVVFGSKAFFFNVTNVRIKHGRKGSFRVDFKNPAVALGRDDMEIVSHNPPFVVLANDKNYRSTELKHRSKPCSIAVLRDDDSGFERNIDLEVNTRLAHIQDNVLIKEDMKESTIHAIDLDSGKEMFSHKFAEKSTGPVYVRGEDDMMYVLRHNKEEPGIRIAAHDINKRKHVGSQVLESVDIPDNNQRKSNNVVMPHCILRNGLLLIHDRNGIYAYVSGK
jgi:outer membrane protein assembly factor BamB